MSTNPLRPLIAMPQDATRVTPQREDPNAMWERLVREGTTPDEATKRVVGIYGEPKGYDEVDAETLEAPKPETVTHPMAKFGRLALHGATFGLSDNIGGTIRGALTPRMSMAEGRAAEKQIIDEAQSEHPVASFGAEMSGALLSGSAVKKLGEKALSGVAGRVAPRVTKAVTDVLAGGGNAKGLKGVGTMAGAGALAGAGAAEEGERLEGATKGAIFGGTVGGAGKALSFGAQKLSPLVGAIGSKVADISGIRPAEGVNRFGIEGRNLRALKELGKPIESEGADALKAKAAQVGGVLGEDQSLAEVGGKYVQGHARDIARKPGGEALGEFAEKKMGEQHGRVVNQFDQRAGTKPENTLKTAKAIIAERKESADPLYEAAHSVEVKDNRLRKFFKIKEFQDAYMGEGADIARLEGYDLPDFEKLIAEGGAVPVKAVDYMKRGLDHEIAKRFNDGRAGSALLLKEQREKMLEVVDELVPEFREAREWWKGESELLEALAFGTDDANKIKAAEVSEWLNAKKPDGSPKRTAGEKDLALRGFRDAVVTKIRGTSDESDVARALSNEEFRDKVRAFFPDKQQAATFIESLGYEVDKSKNLRGIAGKVIREGEDISTSGVEDVASQAAAGRTGLSIRGLAKLGQEFLQNTGTAKDITRNQASLLSGPASKTLDDLAEYNRKEALRRKELAGRMRAVGEAGRQAVRVGAGRSN